jgi:hypothetical protein
MEAALQVPEIALLGVHPFVYRSEPLVLVRAKTRSGRLGARLSEALAKVGHRLLMLLCGLLHSVAHQCQLTIQFSSVLLPRLH